MSVDPEIFPIFQHKAERIPHFARVTEVRHIYISLKNKMDIKNRAQFCQIYIDLKKDYHQ